MVTPMQARLAAASAIVAAPALLLSAAALALFFGGAGDVYGPLNDVLVTAVLLLFIAPVVTLARTQRTATGELLAWVCTAGLVIAAVGQLLLVARVISLEASFMTGTLGIVPVIAWAVAHAYSGIRRGSPSALLGWFMAGVLGLAALVATASAAGIQPAVWALSVALVVTLAAYFLLLGRWLRRAAVPTSALSSGSHAVAGAVATDAARRTG